jgi:DNA-binding response OmpR family regulator
MSSQGERRSASSASREGAPDRPTLLIVDDHPMVLATLSEYLRREGFEVEATTSPAAAIDLARSRRFSLAIVDMRMPEMDGLAVGRALKALKQDFIFLTGQSELGTSREPGNIGALGHIEKPADPATVVAVVRRVLERRGNEA